LLEHLLPRWAAYLASVGVTRVPALGTAALTAEQRRAQNLLTQLILQEAVKHNAGREQRSYTSKAHDTRNLTGVRPRKP
jgi:hypothetical protein